MSAFDLIIQWLVLFGVAAVLAMRGQLTPFHPTSFYLLFHTIVFCIRPTLIYAFDFDNVWDYMLLNPEPEHLQMTLVLSSAGLIIFCVAFAFACPHTTLEPRKEKFRDLTRDERVGLFLTALVFVPAGFFSIFKAQVEGERIGGVFIMTGTSGYLNDLQQVLVPMVVLAIIAFRWRWYAFIPLLIYIYFRAGQGHARWTFVIPIIAIGLFYLWQHRKMFPSWKILLPIPIVAFIFLNLTHDRGYFKHLIQGEETRAAMLDEDKDFAERFDTLDFANFDYLTYIVTHVPESTGRYTHGVQHLQMFTEPIPRKLWPGKPVGAPISYYDLNNYGNFIGLTPSLVGDGWQTGGWIGMAITMALAGFGLGVLTNWFFINQHDLFRVSIFLIVNALLIQLFRDGSMVAMAKFLLFTLMPIFVWHWISAIIAYQRLKYETARESEDDPNTTPSLSAPNPQRGG